MKKKYLLFVLFITATAFAQDINDYQYVIVPMKFSFSKQNDQYRLNTTTKLFLQKYGFKSFLSTDELPDAITTNNCTRLMADVVQDNSLFMTKLKVVLKDCKDKIVYETDFGTSREKEYTVAYNEAIRTAFKSFDKLTYKFNGKNDSVNVPKIPEIPTTPVTDLASSDTSAEIFFFAQPIANGFQVVNSEPRVIMRLLNTSQKNVYIGIKGDTHGVVITKNSKWTFEYYENGKLVSEALNIKF